MSDIDPQLSIVIVSMKERENIECIQSIDKSTAEKVEIIVRNDEGICTARNEGIAQSSSEKIIFLDDDAIPCEGYINRAIKILEEFPIIGGRIIDTGHKWIGKTVRHYEQGDELQPTDQIVGCNMGFQKEVFETIGGFDENIKWGHDEKELINRAQNEYEIYYDPNLCVYHPYSTGFRDYLKKRYQLGIADIYYWDTVGEPIGLKAVSSSLSPKEYLDYSVKGTLMKTPTGFAKLYGRLQGYSRLKRGKSVFE